MLIEESMKEFLKKNESKYYDRQGKIISLMQFANLFEDDKYKIVNKTIIGKYLVSTVWLGSDHNFRRHFDKSSKPIIFETMVFNEEAEDWKELDMERYSTEEEALIGHEEMVKLVKETYDHS